MIDKLIIIRFLNFFYSIMIEQDLSEDIIKMAKHLSMLLGIPLIGDPADINFVV